MSAGLDWNISEEEIESVRAKADLLQGEVELGKSVEQIIYEHTKTDFQELTDEECKKIAETIAKNSAMFTEKLGTEDIGPSDVKNTIIELIKDMPAEDALEFLKLLSYVKEINSSSAIKQILAGQSNIELSDIENSIKERLETKSDLSAAEQIDILIDNISSDEMDTLALIGGNAQLLDALKGSTDITGTSQFISDYTKDKINTASDKALLSYAVYSEAKKGNLSGVPAEIDPAMVTIFVNGGIEKAKVVEALANGEIDEKTAETLIQKIGVVMDILLTIVIAGLIMYSVALATSAVLISIFCIGPVTGMICLVLGLLLGFETSDRLTEGAVEVIEKFFTAVYQKAIIPAFNLIKKIFVKEKGKSIKNQNLATS